MYVCVFNEPVAAVLLMRAARVRKKCCTPPPLAPHATPRIGYAEGFGSSGAKPLQCATTRGHGRHERAGLQS